MNLWDWGYVADFLPTLLLAFGRYTLVATVLGTILGALLGLVFAVVRRARVPVLAQLTTVFIEVIRSTPIPVQLVILVYVLPDYGLTLDPLRAGIVGLGVHYACYYAEVYRAGIEDVPPGQWEAATALNLSRRYMWTDVVLPQAVRRVLPALGNYAISMFKETPFLYLISVPELVRTAKNIAVNNVDALEPFTIAGVIFLAASYPTAVAIRRLERRLEVT